MRVRPWALLAATLAACTSTKTETAPSGDATTLDGLDSAAFARIADLAPLATRAELSSYATLADLVGFATTTQLAAHPTFGDLTGYATLAQLDGLATAADLAAYATTAQLAGYATSAQLVGYATAAQLSAYATTTQLTAALAACVDTGDARLSDARPPLAGSAAYVQNQQSAPQAASFWIGGGARVDGDATVAGNLSVSGAISGRLPSLPTAAVVCNPANTGYVYFNATTASFMGCDGTRWLCLGGPACSPVRSCRDVLQSGASTGSGTYTLQGAYGPYTAYCDMESAGGGWTHVLSSAWNAPFMGGDSASWYVENGVSFQGLAVDHKAAAFDQVAGWTEVRITTSTGTRTFQLRFPAQVAPLRALFASGLAVAGQVTQASGYSSGAACTNAVLNGIWTTTPDGLMKLRIGIPERATVSSSTDAPFPCTAGDPGGLRSGIVGPYWPGNEGLGFAVGARSGFATCDGSTRTFCDAGESPRIHVWIR